ncbi:MAG: hypothetical protein IPK80_11225 [Nannocystis sp.]|nr:hypothetical protein [Nannocystis sp.]
MSEVVMQIGLSAAVSLGIKAFGVELVFDMIDRTVTTKASAFMVISIEMEAPAASLADYRLTNETRDLLRQSPSRFYQRCGDGFIAATKQGGLFVGVIAVEGESVERLKRMGGWGRDQCLGARGAYSGLEGGSRLF